MGIYVLHTMFGKDNYLTFSKLQTSCFYHIYFKNYKLLNMITPPKYGEYGLNHFTLQVSMQYHLLTFKTIIEHSIDSKTLYLTTFLVQNFIF